MGGSGATAAVRPATVPASTEAAGRQWRELALLWALGVAYAMLLSAVTVDATPATARVFNEMLVRLLQGRFDISPATIGDEAILYHGHTYAYFGIFCALLRLPILLVGRIDADVTKASILVAAAVSLGARLLALNIAAQRVAGLSRPLRLILFAAVAFGGESIQFLRPSLFQEVCSWGAALAAVFVLLAVARLFGRARRPLRLYAGMALAAGLALLCRVSFGLGLYAALGLMLCVEAWRARSGGGLAVLKALAPAAAILVLFAGAAAWINAARWDSPLTFVPFRNQAALVKHGEDRLQRLQRYGELNLARLPFALQYYLAPVWVLPGADGGLLLQKTQLRLFDDVELPPSSLLLSDPAVCLLAGLGVCALGRRRALVPDLGLSAAGLAGLASPIAVLLLAISLSFRYRMDFYPALDFAACLGVSTLRPGASRSLGRLFLALAAAGAAVAFASLWLYYFAPMGTALDLDLSRGWMSPIREMADGRNPYVGHLLPDGRRSGAPAVLHRPLKS